MMFNKFELIVKLYQKSKIPLWGEIDQMLGAIGKSRKLPTPQTLTISVKSKIKF